MSFFFAHLAIKTHAYAVTAIVRINQMLKFICIFYVPILLLHSDAFRQIPRLIDVTVA